MKNIDNKTIESFGDEWSRFDQEKLNDQEIKYLFDKYFHIFPWSLLPDKAEGFDMGCGSGRWAALVAPKVEKLNCIDPSKKALDITRKKLKNYSNTKFIEASVSDIPLPPNSQDFGYSLGVLHHVPNTQEAIKDCVKMLKPRAPLLIYLYYKFDNRSKWYKSIWHLSNIMRIFISRMPSFMKSSITTLIAIFVYFPFARLALIGEKMGLNVNQWLLSSYRKTSLYTMKTDSRDRFGTPLEKRFSRKEIKQMMQIAGLKNIQFSESFPFWCAVGFKF